MWPKRDDTLKLNEKAVDRILAHRGITRYELAKLINQDKTTVRRWITGEMNPTRPNVHAIADALDCDIEHLTGEKPFVPDPEPETESVPPSDTPNSAEGGGTATLPDKGFLGEVEVDENDLVSWNAEQKTIFLSAIGGFLKLGCPVRLVGRPRVGSVKLNLRLTREQWERLQQAFAAGELAHLKVSKVEPFYELSEARGGFADPESEPQPITDRNHRIRPLLVGKLKAKSGRTWKEIAKACQVHPGDLKRWLSGEPARIDNISLLAESIGVIAETIILPDGKEDLTDYTEGEITIDGDVSKLKQPQDILTMLDAIQEKIGAKHRIFFMYVGSESIRIGIRIHISDALRLVKKTLTNYPVIRSVTLKAPERPQALTRTGPVKYLVIDKIHKAIEKLLHKGLLTDAESELASLMCGIDRAPILTYDETSLILHKAFHDITCHEAAAILNKSLEDVEDIAGSIFTKIRKNFDIKTMYRAPPK